MNLQREIPGTERPAAIPEIDEAAAKYFALNEERKKLVDQASDARALLAKRMNERKISKYIWIDGDQRKVCVVETQSDVKMRNPQRGEEEPADGRDDKSADPVSDSDPF